MTKELEIPFMPSTIETIDTGFFEWIDNDIDISVNTNSGWTKVPVVWLGTERSYQIKHNKQLRDSVGKLKLPIIALTRVSIEKDLNSKILPANRYPIVQFPGDHKRRSYKVYKRINQNKTREFANKNLRIAKSGKTKDGNSEYTGVRKNKKIVYEVITAPQPVYVTMKYSIILRSEYQQQMNTMLQPFLTYTGNINSFFFEKDNHKYEAFIQQSFDDTNNRASMNEDERKFETKVEVKVLGYLMGAGPNDPVPEVAIRETQVEIRISKERTIAADSRPWAKDDGKYRE